MKTALINIVLILTVTSLSAQTEISGEVIDGNANPVGLANIILVGSFDGCSSDETGKFRFATTENGTRELHVSAIGYRTFRTTIEAHGHPIFLTIQLEEEIHSLEAVTITAGSFMAGDQSRRTVFRAVDIATTAGATADIAGALNTLPGTQKVGESGRLFVRGGDGNETRTFIDGQVVFDAYGPSPLNAPSRGRFLPFMFKGTSFSTGGYSAEYGQALSSALVLDSKDKAEMTRTDFGLLSVGGDAAHTQAWDRGSIAAKIQYTNLQPYFGLINQNVDWRTAPKSLEGHAAFRQQSGKHGLLKIYGTVNQSDFSLNNHSIDYGNVVERYDRSNQYKYLNGFYKNVLSNNWIIRGGLSWSDIHDNAMAGSSGTLQHEKGLHVKTVLEGSLSDRVEIRTGVEVINRAYRHQADNLNPRTFNESITAYFVEADVLASNRFVFRGGGRVEYNALNRRVGMDPRISLAKKVGSGQVSLAYGKFRQSPANEFLRVNHTLRAEKADHYIINYQIAKGNRILRIEGYHKRYSHLVKFAGENAQDINNAGYGFAQGAELFWRDAKSVKNIDYWISYSFLNTRRNYLRFPVAAVPPFASKHNASIVYKYFITAIKSQLGITGSYTSGRPYYDPNDHEFNGNATPAYFDLSFNWSYLPHPSLIVYLSCTNLTGRDNIFGYEFSSKPNEHGVYTSRPIGAPARRFVFLAVFLTLSKEKSVNQLRNL